MRKTQNLLELVSAILTIGTGRIHGYELFQTTGIAPSRVYPRLHEFLEKGWLTDAWESADEVAGQGRPPRRYYLLTEIGRQELMLLAGGTPVAAAAPAKAVRQPRPRLGTA